MKNIFRNITVVLFLATMVSCEDFIVRPPKDELNPDNYFKTASQCQLYTNEFYTILPSSSIYEETADYIITTTLGRDIIGDRPVPATSDDWKWTKLRDINFFLSRSHQCEDEAVRAEYEGLARFFRAYFYFEKVKRYGDVPWVDRPMESTDKELYKGRDSRKIVMKHVLDDIDFAIDNLPSEKNVYRVTKWTALALKSRIFLFEGTFRKYHALGDWEECLTEAAQAAEKFIDESGYTIYKSGEQPYRDLFASIAAKSEEIVLARAYNDEIQLTHGATDRYTKTSAGCPGLTKDVVNMYLMKDGSRFTDKPGYATMNFASETKDRDPRMAQTIRTPGYKRIDGSARLYPDFDASTTGYQITKYVLSEAFSGSFNMAYNDLPIFRSAEVYLNFAEAKAELGTLTQNDLKKSVDKVRARVGMKSLDMAAANSKPDGYLDEAYPGVTGANKGVILEIRRERTVELLAEGFRYWDIMRWKLGQRFVRPFEGMYFPSIGACDIDGDGKNDHYLYGSGEGKKPGLDSKTGLINVAVSALDLSGVDKGNIRLHRSVERVFNENKDYLYPIPTEDIVLTSGVITQNPGWEDGLDY